MNFYVGQMVLAINGPAHPELIGRPGTVVKVGVDCVKPYVPEERTLGLEVDLSGFGKILGAYACWAPIDAGDPSAFDFENEELPEDAIA